MGESEKRKRVLKGNAFYEIDLECMRKKEEKNKKEEQKRQGKLKSQAASDKP